VSYRYCSDCKKVFQHKTIKGEGISYVCPKCSSTLYYFGRESVKLSHKRILSLYDQDHAKDPRGDFMGIYETVFVPKFSDVEVLDCEDVLKSDPNNVEALFFIGSYYLSLKQFRSGKRYFKKLLKINPAHILTLQKVVDVLVYQKAYKKALPFLRRISFLNKEPAFRIQLHFATVYLAMKSYKKALEYFHQAYFLTKVKKQKRYIKQVVRYINRLVED